jgi:AraC-like DNA-binding protein
MSVSGSVFNLSLSMLYAGFKRVESWWNFKDVMSPFYRLYYIADGKGKVYINNIPYELSSGQLFLIPKFAFHSYECSDFMDHYYICFFDDFFGGIGVPNPQLLKLQLSASSLDLSLMRRYMELNPYKALPIVDPQRYDNVRTIYENNSEVNLPHFQKTVESNGILLQLFSRFITEESMMNNIGSNSYEKLEKIIQYINKNLHKHISIQELAEMMCLTHDHFSKVFKKILGMSPCEYIQMKRIERAQTLLLTSHLSITQIAEKVGVNNPSQFTRLFTKIAQCSPREYRVRLYDYIGEVKKCGKMDE